VHLLAAQSAILRNLFQIRGGDSSQGRSRTRSSPSQGVPSTKTGLDSGKKSQSTSRETHHCTRTLMSSSFFMKIVNQRVWPRAPQPSTGGTGAGTNPNKPSPSRATDKNPSAASSTVPPAHVHVPSLPKRVPAAPGPSLAESTTGTPLIGVIHGVRYHETRGHRMGLQGTIRA